MLSETQIASICFFYWYAESFPLNYPNFPKPHAQMDMKCPCIPDLQSFENSSMFCCFKNSINASFPIFDKASASNLALCGVGGGPSVNPTA
mmetsp:Transcript_16188/g.20508  ORF Transcript_16188/g.20508 Transcript_16188/m.20508 type:complete len:91 (+) Transcript_16188:1721-1993(+)